MAHYYCGFKTDSGKEEMIKKQLIEKLKEKELIDDVFDEDLSASGDSDYGTVFAEMLQISEAMPDVLIWVDIYFDTSYIYREYYKNGVMKTVDAVISFPECADFTTSKCNDEDGTPKEYTVNIEETFVSSFSVIATTAEGAREIIQDDYENGEIVVDHDEICCDPRYSVMDAESNELLEFA